MDYHKRIEDFRKLLSENGIDAAFLTRRFVIGYFTGAFTPWYSALFIPVEGEAVLITRDIDAPRVLTQSHVKPVLGWSTGEKSMVSVMSGILHERKLEKAAVGFEIGPSTDVGVLSAREYLELRERWPELRFRDVLSIATGMQLLKTPEEIELLRRAAESVDLGMKRARDALRIGMTEIELAGYAELGIREGGSMFNWCITGTEIGAGYRQSLSGCLTSIPGTKRIQYGEIVTIDIHSMVDLYISDLALNAIIGKPTAAQQKLADDWETLVEYMYTLLRPGAVCGDVADAVIRKSAELGVEHQLVKSFAHGLGLDARMPPYIKPGAGFVLEENMCLVQVLQLTEPGVGGMRLEMPVLIHADGCEPLCRTPIGLYRKDA